MPSIIGQRMINKLKKLVLSDGVRSASIITVGNIVGTGISAIAIIIFSRIMGPENFGIFSALFSLLLISSKLADLGTNIAAQRYIAKNNVSDKEKSQSMIHSVFYIKSILLFAVIVVGYILSPFIAHNFLKIEEVNYVRLSFILLAPTVYYEYFLIVALSTHKYLTTALMTILQATGKLVSALALISLNYLSVFSGFLLYASAPLVGALYSWAKLKFVPWTKPKLLNIDIKYLKKTLFWTGSAIISATLADNLDVLLVKNLLSSLETGLWSAAYRISTFAGLLGISVGMVLNIRVASYETKEHIDKYLKKARLASLLMFLAILTLVPFGRLGILLTAGKDYLSASGTLSLLLVSSAILSATSPFVALYYQYEKPQYYAYSGFLLTAVLIVGDLLFIPRFGLMGAAWVKVITRLSVFIFTLWYSKKSYKELFDK